MASTKRSKVPSKIRIKQFTKAIIAARDEWQLRIENLATEARAILAPYFAANGFDYMSGMGTWRISRIDEDGVEVLVDDDELAPNIRDLLSLEVDRNGDVLGLYVADIERTVKS